MTNAGDIQDDLWTALKRCPYPVSARSLSERVGGSIPYVHRVLMIWTETDYLIRERIAGAWHYSMRLDASHIRPLLRRDGDVTDREAHMPGEELAAIRAAVGMSRKEFARALSISGHVSQQTARITQMEAGNRPVTKPVAEAARALCASLPQSSAGRTTPAGTKRSSALKAREFDDKFDAGEDASKDVDWSQSRRARPSRT